MCYVMCRLSPAHYKYLTFDPTSGLLAEYTKIKMRWQTASNLCSKTNNLTSISVDDIWHGTVWNSAVHLDQRLKTHSLIDLTNINPFLKSCYPILDLFLKFTKTRNTGTKTWTKQTDNFPVKTKKNVTTDSVWPSEQCQ